MDDENPQTSTLCKGMIADLECICRAYVFNYEKIDHDVIIDRLYEIIQQSKCLRDNPALFSDMEEYRRFKEKIIDLAQTITCIIKMWEDRNTKRAEIQEKMRHKRFRAHRPTLKLRLLPWNQFLNRGSPGLPPRSRPAPNLLKPDLPPLVASCTSVQGSSVQVLPRRGHQIITNWVLTFKHIMDHLRWVQSFV